MEQQKKKPEASGGGGGGSGSLGVSKISARPGGNIGTGRRGLGASTASSRNASRGAAGGRRGVLGKGKGRAAAGPGGWGEEEESALKGLAEKLGVVRKQLELKEFLSACHTLPAVVFVLFFFPALFPPSENLGAERLKQENRKTTGRAEGQALYYPPMQPTVLVVEVRIPHEECIKRASRKV